MGDDTAGDEDDPELVKNVLRSIMSDGEAPANARIRAALALAELAERERIRRFNEESLAAAGL